MFQNIKDYFKRQRPLPIVFYHLGATRDWIESLDLTQPYHTARHIGEKCKQLLDAFHTRSITFQTHQLETCFLLDTPLLSLLNSLHGCYIQAVQEHHVEHEHGFLKQLHFLIDSVIQVYEYLNSQLAQYPDPWEIYHPHAEVNIRLMHMYMQRMRINRYQHEAIPSLWWRKLHTTYRLAYYREWLNRSTQDDRIPSIEENYIYSLLLNALDSGGYPADLYPFIDQILHEAPPVQLLGSPVHGSSATVWWADLGSDKGLQRAPLSSIAPSTHARWLDIVPLIQHLNALTRTLSEHLGLTYDMQARADLTQRLRLIEKLNHDWSPTPTPIRRVAQRRVQLEPVQWLAGIEAIHALYFAPEYLHTPTPTSQETLMSQLFSHGSRAAALKPSSATRSLVFETGYLKDVSLYGCALRVKASPDLNLAVGTLVVYRRSSGEAWCMGIIRRIRRTLRTEMEMGIEHLGSNWSVVDYLYSSNDQPETRETALYFPLDDRNSLSKKALLMSMSAFDDSPHPAVRLGNDLYPIAFTAILEKKRGWALISFDVLNPKPASPSSHR